MIKYSKCQKAGDINDALYVEAGTSNRIPVGTVKDYIYLTEKEAAKLIYHRVNKKLPDMRKKSITECTEFASILLSNIPSDLRIFTEFAKVFISESPDFIDVSTDERIVVPID